MLNSSLMDILTRLNQNELKDLREYIYSPFFNKNKNVQKLYDYLYKLYPEYPADKMKKEYVYKKLFGTGKFNDGFMRTLIFIITKLAEDYLAYVNYSKDRYNSKICLINELHKREIDRILFKNLKAAEKEFSTQAVKDEKYFRAMHDLQNVKNDSQVLKERTLNAKEVENDLSLKILDYQVIQFLISAMNSYIFILNRGFLVDVQYDLTFLDEIISLIEKNISNYSEYPLVMLLYYELRLLLDKENEFYYNELKKIVLNTDNNFNYIERYNGLVGLQNFCMRIYNSGRLEYLYEIFNIIEFTLKEEYYSSSPGGYFLPQHFKNFVIIGTNIKKFEWTETFIKNYVKKLSPENRENAYSFSMAKVYVAKRDFEKALWYISRVSYQDLYYKLEVRYYTLMIYFELSMFNEAYDLIESYKKYIVNNKLLNNLLKNKHLSFIKFCNELLKIKMSGNTKKLRSLEKSIKNSPNTLNAPWLLYKLDELNIQLEKA